MSEETKLEVGWFQAGFLGDAGQHPGPKFVSVPKGPDIRVRKIRVAQFSVGTDLPDEDPSNFQKRFVDNAGLGGRPLASRDTALQTDRAGRILLGVFYIVGD